MGLILDTSAIVAWERALGSGRRPKVPREAFAIPAIVWAEALAGVRMADSSRRAAARQSNLEKIRALGGIEPFTAEVAGHYADIFAELASTGGMIPQKRYCRRRHGQVPRVRRPGRSARRSAFPQGSPARRAGAGSLMLMKIESASAFARLQVFVQ